MQPYLSTKTFEHEIAMESWYYQYKLQAPLEDNNTILQPKKKTKECLLPFSFNSSDDITHDYFVKLVPFLK